MMSFGSLNPHKKIAPTLGWILLAIAALPAVGRAQIDPSSFLSATSVNTTTSNYYFAKPNELTIVVNVMGFVQRPGRYEVSSSIDLVNLLSLAGGPGPDGTLGSVKITRLVNTANRVERKVIRLDLDDLPSVNNENLVLHPGDLVEVERSGWATVRDIFTVIGYAAVLTTTIVTVLNYTQR